MAGHYAQMRHAQVLAARAIVRRGIGRGEIAPGDRRPDLARNVGAYAAQLVSFLLRAVTPA